MMPITLNGYTAEGIEELKRENDELKAMVNAMSDMANSISGMSDLGEAYDAACEIMDITPEQCLLEHDKKVIKKAFWWSAEFTSVVHNNNITYAWTDYCENQLGGNDAK